MAIDAPSSTFFSPWPDRLRHSAIILLAAGLALAVLVAFGELSLLRAAAVFVCIAAAALVPLPVPDAHLRMWKKELALLFSLKATLVPSSDNARYELITPGPML